MTGEKHGVYQSELKERSACALPERPKCVLTGCGFPSAGIAGRREELAFVCGDKLPPEESGAGSGPEETLRRNRQASLENEVSEESTVREGQGRSRS